MKRIIGSLLVFMFFVAGAVAYSWPAAEAIWEMRSDRFMSDGTDLTTNPFQFDFLHQEYTQNPSLFFYGAFPNHRLDAPEGTVSWYAVVEKVAGLVFPYFVPVEQVSALLALSLMVLNGLCFYGMARSFQWNRVLSLALSTAWAFSAYTRARAQVHASLVGIFMIPLALWGISILQKDRSRKGILKASLCFLGCATAPHYYLIFLLVLSPFFVIFYFSDPNCRQRSFVSLRALIASALPAVLFLGLSFWKPVPAEFQTHVAQVLPMTGRAQSWPHPFVEVFSAQPRDYFSGDIAIGSAEWNPLRAEVNEKIRKDPSVANFHEHALGIRWTVWIMALLSLCYVFIHRRNYSWKTSQGGSFWAVVALGTFAFLASLPPDWGFMWGPSAWIHRLVEQIRVPNRLGIFVHFSLLFIAGLIFQRWLDQSRHSLKIKRAVLFTFFALIFLDFPPGLNPMPMASTVPSRSILFSMKEGPCGLGMHFPYLSGSHNTLAYYQFLQSLRGTDCSVLNANSENARDAAFIELFGYQNKSMINKILANDPGLKSQWVRFAQCNNLDWMIFDSKLPQAFVQDVCHSWGGKWMGQGLCRSLAPVQKTPLGRPDVCLVQAR